MEIQVGIVDLLGDTGDVIGLGYVVAMDEKIGIYGRYVYDISRVDRLRYDKLLRLSFDGKIA